MHRFRYPAEALNEFPNITASQVEQVTRQMIEINSATLIQVMERGGKAIADVAQCYATDIYPSVFALIGSGYNGGAALTAARYLANDGAHPEIYLSADSGSLPSVVHTQLMILRGMYPEIPVYELGNQRSPYISIPSGTGLILDGLLGCSFNAPVSNTVNSCIAVANESDIPIISVDIPSGLDADTGHPATHTILATATVTFGIPKQGFLHPEVNTYTGELYLADIGLCPKILSDTLHIENSPRHLPQLIYLYSKQTFHRQVDLLP